MYSAPSRISENLVAAVLDADGLTSDEMQRIARWTNLSETTFVLPSSKADYQVRIFTPVQELPFAGHPTLGTCHAWLQAGGQAGEVVVQECAAGLIRIRRGERLAFQAPPLVRSGPVAEADRALAALGLTDAIDVQWVDNGPGWVAVLLSDPDAVLALQPTDLDGFDIGVVAPCDGYLEVRAFFSVHGVCTEDPVTGSLNASVAGWLAELGSCSSRTRRARDGRSAGTVGCTWTATRTASGWQVPDTHVEGRLA